MHGSGWSSRARLVAALLAGAVMAAGGIGTAGAAPKKLKDERIPMVAPEDLPPRTAPIIEIGPDFLAPGDLPGGVELPTGAVWNPALWVFGNYRTAVQHFDGGRGPAVTEWANRLDLFANLRLSGTERILFGMSPLRDEGEFTGYTFEPDDDEGFDNAFSGDITRLFFEGEIVEIFPKLDPGDEGVLDIGFSIGRQPVFFQEGMMANDVMDAVSLTKDNVIIPGLTVDHRFTALWGWNEVNRDNNLEDDGAHLLGLFTEGDWGPSTVQIDAAYVAGRDDGAYFGVAGTQRPIILGKKVNTDLRANASFALEEEGARVDDGLLLFSQLSITPTGTSNLLYNNTFVGIGNYSSAARNDTAGGPLGRTGILFAAVGLGNYGAALGNRADESVGSAVGYQMFFNNERTQVILEAGGRAGTDDDISDAAAVGARFQQAIGSRFVLRADTFVAAQEVGDTGLGFRTEFRTNF